jgi:hypothetical protein
MNEAFVQLPRRFLTPEVLKNHKLCAWMMYCLDKATFVPFNALVEGQVVPLQPGQFVTGRKKAAKELGMTERQIRTVQQISQKMNFTSSRTTNKFSVITVIHLNAYKNPKVENVQQNVQRATSNPPHNKKVYTKEREATAVINTPENQNPSQSNREYIEHLINQYQPYLVQRLFDALPEQPVSEDRKLRILVSWKDFPASRVKSAIQTYLSKRYGEKGKDEWYLRGIMATPDKKFTKAEDIRNERQDDYSGELIPKVKELLSKIGAGKDDIKDEPEYVKCANPNCHQMVLLRGLSEDGLCPNCKPVERRAPKCVEDFLKEEDKEAI